MLWHIAQTEMYREGAQGKRGTRPALASLYRAQAWLQQSQVRTRWCLTRGITAGPPHSATCLCSGRSGLVLNEDCTSLRATLFPGQSCVAWAVCLPHPSRYIFALVYFAVTLMECWGICSFHHRTTCRELALSIHHVAGMWEIALSHPLAGFGLCFASLFVCTVQLFFHLLCGFQSSSSV